MLNKFKNSGKIFSISLLLGFLCAVFLSFTDFNATCEDIRHNVLRLHIIANSDSNPDQSLKLKIRDGILENSGDLFNGVTDLERATQIANEELEVFENIANEIIEAEGFQYKAKVSIGKRWFETRVYDDFTLPAGEYVSLIVDLGEAEGKNWWCVIFPEICLPGATDTHLSDTVGENGAEVAYNPNRYIMRFKSIEIYEKIKNLFRN